MTDEHSQSHRGDGSARSPNRVHLEPPLTISVDEFCRLTSLKRSSAFVLIRQGRIETRKVNRRTLITMRSVRAMLGIDQPSTE